MAHILFIHDQQAWYPTIRKEINKLNHSTEAVNDPNHLFNGTLLQSPDMVILDAGLLNEHTRQWCQSMRGNPVYNTIALIVLGQLGQPSFIADVLQAGADDYVLMPFDMLEFMARIEAVLRRRQPPTLCPSSLDFWERGRLRIHKTTPDIWFDNQHLTLTDTEHKLLIFLFLANAKPITSEQLLHQVWDYPLGQGNPNIVQVHITNLRQKLRHMTPDNIIQNRRGLGYFLMI